MARNLSIDLAHAVTRYDREQEAWAKRGKRRYHNPHALGIYLLRVEEVVYDIDGGMPLGDALRQAFERELLAHVEKYLVNLGYEISQTEGV
jgi:hypothetical protein